MSATDWPTMRNDVAQRLRSGVRVDVQSIEALAVLDACIDGAAMGQTARDIAAGLGLRETTLNTRHYKAGVPSAHRLLVDFRSAYMTRMLEAGWKVHAVAYTLGISSPRALSRWCRHEFAITPTEAREWSSDVAVAGAVTRSAGNCARAWNGNAFLSRRMTRPGRRPG